MKNRKGFKETKLGWIPEDWEVIEIKDVLTIGSGKDYKHLKKGSIPVYGSGGIMTFVDKYLYDGESVGIGRKGTIDKPVLLDGKFWTVDTLFYTHSFKGTIPKFVFNVFLTIPWKRYNAASSIPSLSKTTIDNIKIKLPPLSEQKAIANCLSTWETDISKQDALIKEKQQLKKALMQQLLSGKKRLSGFSSEWPTKTFEELFKKVSRPVEWDDHAVYDLISVRRRSGGLFHRDSLEGAQILTKKLYTAKKGDFLISKMQILHGASGLVNDKFNGMKISGSYIAVVPKSNTVLNMGYMEWYSKTPKFYHQTYRSSYGVHIEKMTFNYKLFAKEQIVIPSIKEQIAIAQVLNTADQEINLLTNQRNQLQLQKKGLMQQLLTGKKRLKV